MKNLKEIEAKIDEIRKYEKTNGHDGWLVGLGMAKAIVKVATEEDQYDFIQDHISGVQALKLTPYEQGIKEALEWCLKEGD